MTDHDKARARSLARLLGIFHNISYYAPEMKAFAEVGLPEYWRAYTVYRSAPMGEVRPSVVTASFYNFAPRVIDAALPSAWTDCSPEHAISLRDDCIARALDRALGPAGASSGLAEAASLALGAIEGVNPGARPLFASHAALEVPVTPQMRLWHACTLWREHRGDGHNMALAAAEVDGVECHVVLVAKGVGDFEVIRKIRGWTPDELEAAALRLRDRGLVDAEGKLTETGRALREDVEHHTDALAAEPRRALGTDADRLIELMEPLVRRLVETGGVAASWPPKGDRTPPETGVS